MARCGCAGTCACVVEANPDCANLEVTGTGTPANPYQICAPTAEIAKFHHPGALTVVASDKYPVCLGGLARVRWELTVAPLTNATLQMLKNGLAAGAPFVITGTTDVFESAVSYATGDTAQLEITDLGTGGAEGLVCLYELHA